MFTVEFILNKLRKKRAKLLIFRLYCFKNVYKQFWSCLQCFYLLELVAKASPYQHCQPQKPLASDRPKNDGLKCEAKILAFLIELLPL